MTFTDIRDEILDRLHLPSTEAETRIGRAVNRVYKAVTTTIGLDTSRRVNATADTTIGEQEVTFSGVEKLISVWDPSGGSNRILEQVTHADLLSRTPTASDSVSRCAVSRMNAGSVTITLDCIPQSEFTLHGQGHDRADTLSGSQEPAFPESFHDILIEGVLTDEYHKAEKPSLAQMSKAEYEQRFPRGTYMVSASLVFPQGIEIVGSTWGAHPASYLILADSATVDGLLVSERWAENATSTGTPVIIRDLVLKGNRANSATGKGTSCSIGSRTSSTSMCSTSRMRASTSRR